MRIVPVLVTLLIALIATSAGARVVLDRSDPVFAGAISIPLPPAGLGTTERSFQFVSNGITIGLQSTSGQPLRVPVFAPGIFVSTSGSVAGVVVNLSAPVAAVGFVMQGIDGCPGADFVGSAGTARAESSFPCPNVFIGAADIGSIGVVNLRNTNSLFRATEIVIAAGAPPIGAADVGVFLSTPTPLRLPGEELDLQLGASNAGPDPATDATVIGFLDPNATYVSASAGGAFDATANTVRWNLGTTSAGSSLPLGVELMTPVAGWICQSQSTHVALTTSTTPDPLLTNNVSTRTIYYDQAAVASNPETCGNRIDDNCDGRTDCADSSCDCRPTLPPSPGNDDCTGDFGGIELIEGVPGQDPLIVPQVCAPEEIMADQHECRVPRGRCGGVTVPAFCCDPATWSNPSLNGSASLASCDLGVPGCAPVDPNYKESDPTVNLAGYGQTEAGRTMSYVIHYENIGNADALEVEILDVLDPDLDDSTLVIADGGRYDASTRTLRWIDPVVPPNTPREVSFRVAVRSDAQPGTRVRNVGTIVFPNAVPPSRIDTDFVEHVIPDPVNPPIPHPRVASCTQTSSGVWRVDLVNEGAGYAYRTRAIITSTPSFLRPSDTIATFAHKDDVDPVNFGTLIPNARTTSRDPVRFNWGPNGDPCPAFGWRIEWENIQGQTFSRDQAGGPDRDRDGVLDDIDNCPDVLNPTQADSDGDGLGDFCDLGLTCDIDNDSDVDRVDTNLILAVRNRPAAVPVDKRDADGDGRITVLDARKCTTLCTRPLCATQ